MRALRPVAVGERLEPRSIGPITQTDIVRFAGAGGDFNPLHHDPAFAESAGFGSVIAMGQMQAAILAAYLTDWIGIEHLREFEVRFVGAVLLGATLELTAEVVSIDAGVAEISLTASVDNAPVVTARAKAAVAS